MNRGIAAIWWAMLIATVAAVVPAAVTLLSRALKAARNIEQYTAEALEGGVKVAGNTANVAALKDTIVVAGGLIAGANSLVSHTATIASALAPAAPATAVTPATPTPTANPVPSPSSNGHSSSGNGTGNAEEVQL